MRQDLEQAVADNNDVEQDKNRNHADRNTDRFAEADHKNHTQKPDQEHRDANVVVAQNFRREWIFGDVLGGRAAESVMVIIKPVATKPSKHSTNSLLFQAVTRCSNIEIEPSPCGLFSSATRLYIGSAPKSVTSTRRKWRTARVSAASAAMRADSRAWRNNPRPSNTSLSTTDAFRARDCRVRRALPVP